MSLNPDFFSSCPVGFSGLRVDFEVPSMLHTPLMSGTNAIHGSSLLGGMLRWPPPRKTP